VSCPDPCPPLLLQLLVYGLTNGAIIALSAAGFTLAYAVARQINLAHGNVFALTTVALSYGAGWLGVTAAAPIAARIGALLALTVAGAAIGAGLNGAVERLAFRPFACAAPTAGRPCAPDRLGPLVATVGISFVLFQAAVWWYALFYVPTGGVTGHVGVVLPLLAMPDLVPRVELCAPCGGVSFTLKDALVLGLAGLVALGAAALLARTRAGRALRAAAQDAELAALSGADPNRVRLLAFAIAGGLVGFAAAISAAYYGGTTAHHGVRAVLTAMTAAILGGAGNPGGALVGGVLLGVGSAYADFFLDPKWTPVLILALLVGLLAVRPSGLLASPPPEGEGVGAPARELPAGVLLGLLALGALYPSADAAFGWGRLPSATGALLLVALAVGLGVVVVFAGLLDLGYAAFFALGGYTAALLTSSGSRLAALAPWPLGEAWVALGLAGAVVAGFGLLFGLPSVRTRGEYLAIVTIALGEIVPGVIWHLPEWTGGPRGMSGVALPRLGLPVAGPTQAYVLTLALAAGAALAARRLAPARGGRAWAAVRDDETAAASLGIRPARAKLLAFACGAAVAGWAGALFAGQIGYVEPGQFDFTLSLMVLAAVVAGGRWGVGGIALGALAIAVYDRVLVELLSHLVGVDLRPHNLAVFGVALYLTTLARARGYR
jgi:branched-chain amino acid transport system permease protein